MKQLGIKFGDTQALKISDLSDVIGVKNSEVGRAAMQLGLMQIQALAARDIERSKELVLVNAAKGQM